MDSNQSSAYADAVLRARQIAAKLGTGDTGQKRVAESVVPGIAAPEAKRPAIEDPIIAQLRANAEQNRAQIAAAAAANGAPGGFGASSDEEYLIPDNLVGMVIGKGGEQIIRLQNESGCKIQIAPDSMGGTHRSSSLTGTPEARARCKQLLDEIVERGRQNGAPMDPSSFSSGQTQAEILVPGQKAGLIIGKGGETIKKLQEDNNVKMVMIQDTNQPTVHDKPLRITGAEPNVQAAKEQVLALLNGKDGGVPQMSADYGSAPRRTIEVPVPAAVVGVIIGKQGDMIRKIQAESDARVQFKKDDMPGMMERMCVVSGTPQSVQIAEQKILQLINEAQQGRMGGGGPGGGPPGQDCTQFPVPNEKCGFVIGKGGENVKQINHASGAHVEISKDPPPNPNEKMFRIKGTPDQIRHAIRLICERADMPIPSGSMAPGPAHSQPWHAQPDPQGYGNQQQWQPPYGDPQQKPQTAYPGTQGAWGGYNPGYGQPAANPQPPTAAAAATPGQPTAQASIDPVTGQADYTEAWAQYFRGRGMTDYADAILKQSRAKSAGGPAPAGAPGAAPVPQQPQQQPHPQHAPQHPAQHPQQPQQPQQPAAAQPGYGYGYGQPQPGYGQPQYGQPQYGAQAPYSAPQ